MMYMVIMMIVSMMFMFIVIMLVSMFTRGMSVMVMMPIARMSSVCNIDADIMTRASLLISNRHNLCKHRLMNRITLVQIIFFLHLYGQISFILESESLLQNAMHLG